MTKKGFRAKLITFETSWGRVNFYPEKQCYFCKKKKPIVGEAPAGGEIPDYHPICEECANPIKEEKRG